MTQLRTKLTYSEDQKKQLFELYKHEKPCNEIIRGDRGGHSGMQSGPPVLGLREAV